VFEKPAAALASHPAFPICMESYSLRFHSGNLILPDFCNASTSAKAASRIRWMRSALDVSSTCSSSSPMRSMKPRRGPTRRSDRALRRERSMGMLFMRVQYFRSPRRFRATSKDRRTWRFPTVQASPHTMKRRRWFPDLLQAVGTRSNVCVGAGTSGSPSPIPPSDGRIAFVVHRGHRTHE
jgi:hypothetical protein